ncbi:MAG: hypothetical protein P4L59_18815 [Desulfosporosinus sp.]|nr:hypothetical protein [Desulfosporosinus sp.]
MYKKIKDKFILAIVAGLIGDIALTFSDEIFLRLKISKRSFRESAAGIFVSSQREATSKGGIILGQIVSLMMSISGAITFLYTFSKTGRKHVVTKGIVLGSTLGCVIPALLSSLPMSKVKPTDASSNLSYIFSHCIYGITTALTMTKLADDSVFSSERPIDSAYSTDTTNLND